MRQARKYHRFKALLLAALVSLPLMAAATPGWWCDWFGISCTPAPSSKLLEVADFGANPGNLRMFEYIPQNLEPSRPLVVALHGCLQEASDYDDEPGWTQLADKYRFALLLPQQQGLNNPVRCFNWFLPEHNQRDMGEALSIRQMVERMRQDAASNPKRIFVTGLSGGGGMAAVMMATYPDVFAGGAIIAGIPYKCADTEHDALSQCGVSMPPGNDVPIRNLTPQQWGDLVRNASHTGAPFPPVSIWQGTQDDLVSAANEQELLKQWTNVLNIGQTPAIDETIKKRTHHQVFQDSRGNVLVETYMIKGMRHGTPVDPGTAPDQCGAKGVFMQPVGICSSFYIMKFWGLDKP